MERTWSGRLRPGYETEHQRFVDWLNSEDGAAHLARALLTGYRLFQQDDCLTVFFSAAEPPPIIRFLRNRRFWPEFWEFETADSSAAVGESAQERVSWHVDPAAE